MLLPQRLSLADASFLWAGSFIFFSIVTGGVRYGAVGSVFALANILLLFSWFSLQPVDRRILTDFIENARCGAHRGGAIDSPENTIGAFHQAIRHGAHAIEFDLEFTKDGIPVVLHDDTVDRTTNGTGRISDLKFDQVQQLNAAANFHQRDPLETELIPTMEEVLQLCIQYNIRMFIDVKATNLKLVLPCLLNAYQKYPQLYKIAAVASFFPQIVLEVKRADPRIITGHTWRRGFVTYENEECTRERYTVFWKRALARAVDKFYFWFLHSWLWKFSGADIILASHRLVSRDYLAQWESRGLPVVAWTVNDFHQKLHFMHDLNCPFLTDRLSDIAPEIMSLPRTCPQNKECSP